jgi:hypothetical protein
LTERLALTARGRGVPGEPFRYYVHPVFVGILKGSKKDAEADALAAALEADKGRRR